MSTNNFPVFGMIFGNAGTFTSGIPLATRRTSISVEREKFTDDATSSGNLQHHVTRRIDGLQTSVSDRRAFSDPTSIPSGLIGGDALGPMPTLTERKVFDDGWTIYDAAGTPVGDDDGTSDTTNTPNEGLL